MHYWLLNLLIASMLFMSLEGVAESVDDTSFHQTHHAHADDVGDDWYPDTDGDDHASDACEHFCHVHVVAVVTRHAAPKLSKYQVYSPPPAADYAVHITAPPTPPPNA